jgi:hypothetical protein
LKEKTMGQRAKAPKLVKGHCPSCGPDRNAKVVAYHRDSWDTNDGIWGVDEYMTLKCLGCDRIYFRTDKVFSEDRMVYDEEIGEEIHVPNKTYWPAPARRPVPDWTKWLLLEDDALSELLLSTYTALDHDLRVLAAIGVRTVFDRASELLGVDPAITFAKKLDGLATNGKIGAEEKDSLSLLTDAGGAAAHRGWKPELEELDTMMGILEGFLHRNFVLPRQTKRLKSAVPPKPKPQQGNVAQKAIAAPAISAATPADNPNVAGVTAPDPKSKSGSPSSDEAQT